MKRLIHIPLNFQRQRNGGSYVRCTMADARLDQQKAIHVGSFEMRSIWIDRSVAVGRCQEESRKPRIYGTDVFSRGAEDGRRWSSVRFVHFHETREIPA